MTEKLLTQPVRSYCAVAIGKVCILVRIPCYHIFKIQIFTRVYFLHLKNPNLSFEFLGPEIRESDGARLRPTTADEPRPPDQKQHRHRSGRSLR